MNEILAQLQKFLRSRSVRERWLMVGVLCVLLALVVNAFAVRPLRARLQEVAEETETLQADVTRAVRVVGDVRRLQAELAQVEQLIVPGQKTELNTVLEELAKESGLTLDQLDKLTPNEFDHERYPETRVEVRVKGATLKQTVQLLYKIENAGLHLIVRSLRINKKKKVLDVSFSLSSFERV